MKCNLLILFLVVSQVVFSQIPVDDDIYEIEEAVEVPSISRNSRGLGTYYDKNRKAGLTYKGEKITEAIYDKVKRQYRGGYIVEKEGKFGYFNKTGKEVLEPIYLEITQVGNWYLKIKKKNKFGLINLDGKSILASNYLDILGASASGYALIKKSESENQLIRFSGKKVAKKVKRAIFYKNGVILGNGEKYAIFTSQFSSEFVYDSIPVGNYTLRKRRSKTRYPRKTNDIINTRILLNKIVIVKEGKVGLIDTANNLLIPIEHDEIAMVNGKNYYSVKKGNKFGYYLNKCHTYAEPTYDAVYMDGRRYLKVNKQGLWGVIDDENNEVILPVAYNKIHLTNGAFLITKDKKQGVVDLTGKVKIPAIYNDIDNLNGYFNSDYKGLYKVKMKDKSGVIDENNKEIIPIQYSSIWEFEKKFFIVRDSSHKTGLYSKGGELIQPLNFDHIYAAKTKTNAVYFTRNEGLFGLLNSEGEELYSPQFKTKFTVPNSSFDILFLNRGDTYYQAIVNEFGKVGLLNMYTGKFDLPIEYDHIPQHINLDRFVVKKEGKYGIVTSKNEWIVDAIYDSINLNKASAYPYRIGSSSGFVALKNGKYGAINFSGEVLIPFEYNSLKKIGHNGIYVAGDQNKKVLINQKNEILNEGPFDDIAFFEGRPSRALSFYQGTMREIDESGNYMTQPIPMKPHVGFYSFFELKMELIKALESANDSALYDFAKLIVPSPHLVYLIKSTHLKEKSKYLNYDRAVGKYYQHLLKFKYRMYSSKYFNKENLYTEDFTIVKRGIVTNKRTSNWAYDDTKYLEKILRNAIKINGYWVSSFYMTRFYNRY